MQPNAREDVAQIVHGLRCRKMSRVRGDEGKVCHWTSPCGDGCGQRGQDIGKDEKSDRNTESGAKRSIKNEDRDAAPKSAHGSLSCAWRSVVERCFQPKGEECRQAERQRNTADTGRPTDPVEYLTKDGGADQSAGEVASEIDATRCAAVSGGGLAHKTSRSRLGEKGSNADEHHAQQDQSEIGQQKQRQAGTGQSQRSPQGRPVTPTMNGAASQQRGCHRRQKHEINEPKLHRAERQRRSDQDEVDVNVPMNAKRMQNPMPKAARSRGLRK